MRVLDKACAAKDIRVDELRKCAEAARRNVLRITKLYYADGCMVCSDPVQYVRARVRVRVRVRVGVRVRASDATITPSRLQRHPFFQPYPSPHPSSLPLPLNLPLN